MPVQALQTSRRLFNRVATFIMDALGPLRCPGCGKIGTIACPTCLARVQHHPQVTPGPEPLQAIVSAVQFDQPVVRDLIHALKYTGVKAAAEPLAGLLVDQMRKLLQPGDVIIPIPLHPRRQRERGFNQSELLAHALHINDAIISTTCLHRTRYTKPQVECTGEERRKNLKDAFEASSIDAKHIILLDDVTTTGSTLVEAARALRKITDVPIIGVTVARG
jgi:ComF family protein